MPAYNPFVVQKAVYDALSADATLMAMLTGVYDQAPQGTRLPYLTFGDITARDWSSMTTSGAEYDIPLHSYSRQGGQKEASAILSRVHALLHDASLTLTESQHLIVLRFVSAQMRKEDDGATYRGTIHFKALIQI